MEINKKLLTKLKQAVETREEGKTNISAKLFADLIEETDILNKSQEKADLNLYVQIMTEYVVQLRHEGKAFYVKALKVARDVYSFDKLNSLNNLRSVRGISNTLMNMEVYEIALDYLKELVALTPESDSARKGDAMAHLARCLFRTGKIEEAEKTLVSAFKKIEKNSGKSSLIEIASWTSHALIVNAIVLYSKGKIEDALSKARQSLDIARKESVALRINEALEVISYLNSKI